MEYNVWKFSYNINFTKNNSSINDADIYWEWLVEDYSSYFYGDKQFIVYPYGTTKQTPLNGEQHVLIEGNDRMDEYSSRIIIRAKSRSTGSLYSANYYLSVAAVDH